MKVKVSLSLFILIFLFSSCNHTKNQTASSGFTGDYIIATIETDSIYISEIDKLAKQELYDQLYRIYIIRKVVLNETINNRLLEAEAKRNGKSKDEFISEYYRCMVNDRNIAKYSDKRNFQYIPELKRTLKYYDIKSEKGKELIIESYKRYLLERLTDSLKLVHKINIFLKPPLPPEISLNNIPAHYKGNMNSKITLLEVSDMECDKCREYYPVYEKLYNKYKDKVRFGFTHFASYVTLSAIATECAGRQDKFWEMHDTLIHRKFLPDTAEIFDLTKKIKLNMVRFKKDFTDFDLQSKIEYNFRLLKAYGLYATPTILINGKPIFNSSSEQEIEKKIKEELKK